jgi:tetratricopeptide (TPR) repeat protein
MPLVALRNQYPDQEKPYMLLGEFYCYCLLHQEAAGVYRAGIKALPNSATLHRNLALSLLQLGSLADAQNELQEAIRLAPDDQFAAKLKLVLRACQHKTGAK